MRSAVVAAAMLLAGCGGEKAPTDAAPKAVDPTSSAPAASPPPAPTPTVVSPSEDAYAPAASPVELSFRFQALGTEPFWSVKLVPNTATYTTPEDQQGRPARYAFSFTSDRLRYAWKQDGRSFDLVITKGTCSDGMSDRVYQWKAVLTIDGKPEQGCAIQK